MARIETIHIQKDKVDKYGIVGGLKVFGHIEVYGIEFGNFSKEEQAGVYNEIKLYSKDDTLNKGDFIMADQNKYEISSKNESNNCLLGIKSIEYIGRKVATK